MPSTKPPFRADHVGSLLRPAALKEARAKRERGEITPAQLKAIEDREIEKLIRKQEDVGLKSITDGEFRRAFGTTTFSASSTASRPISASARSSSRVAQPKPMMLRVIGKLGALTGPSDDRALQVRRRAHQADAEDDDPVAVVAAFPLRARRRAGGDLSRHGRFLPRSRRRPTARWCAPSPMPAAAICSSTRSTSPISAIPSCASMSPTAATIPTRCRTIYAAHDQRGDLRHSRRHDDHDASVPRQFPVDLRGVAAATSRSPRSCSTPSTCTAISWNTTASAPAASSRCASCPRARRWCSASSPRRRGTLESKDELKRRIDEAAKFVAARPALPVAAMRLRLDRGRQYSDRGRAMGEAAHDRRTGRRGVGLRDVTIESEHEAHQAAVPRRSCRQPAAARRAEGGAREARARARSRRRAQGGRGPRDRARHQEAGGGRAASRSPTASSAAPGGISISSGASTASRRHVMDTRRRVRRRSRRATKACRSPASSAFPATR